MSKRIVSTTVFINEIAIAGVENSESGACAELCALIDIYEKEYLIRVLGYGFYTIVKGYIDGDADNVPQKYVDLLDGVDYTISERKYEWKGLRYYAARYIYYWYRRNIISQTAGVGELQAVQAENAKMVSSADKMARAYNISMDGAQSCWHYLQNNVDTYPDYNSSHVVKGYFGKMGKINSIW